MMEGQGYEEEIAVTHHRGAGRAGDHHGEAIRSGCHSRTEDSEGGQGTMAKQKQGVHKVGAASVAMTERGHDL